MAIQTPKKKFLTITEVCELVGIARGTLFKWRREGRGPKVVKIGTRCFIRATDFEKWIEQNMESAQETGE